MAGSTYGPRIGTHDGHSWRNWCASKSDEHRKHDDKDGSHQQDGQSTEAARRDISIGLRLAGPIENFYLHLEQTPRRQPVQPDGEQEQRQAEFPRQGEPVSRPLLSRGDADAQCRRPLVEFAKLEGTHHARKQSVVHEVEHRQEQLWCVDHENRPQYSVGIAPAEHLGRESRIRVDRLDSLGEKIRYSKALQVHQTRTEHDKSGNEQQGEHEAKRSPS